MEILPIEIYERIFKFCDINEINKLISTCKIFYNILLNDNLWKIFCKNHWNITNIHQFESYFELYQKMHIFTNNGREILFSGNNHWISPVEYDYNQETNFICVFNKYTGQFSGRGETINCSKPSAFRSIGQHSDLKIIAIRQYETHLVNYKMVINLMDFSISSEIFCDVNKINWVGVGKYFRIPLI